jgi:hypothetical protein
VAALGALLANLARKPRIPLARRLRTVFTEVPVTHSSIDACKIASYANSSLRRLWRADEGWVAELPGIILGVTPLIAREDDGPHFTGPG